jgi:thioredoxin reductase
VTDGGRDDRVLCEACGHRLTHFFLSEGPLSGERPTYSCDKASRSDHRTPPPSVDVVFAEPTPLALDEPLRQLGVETADTPFGSWTAVDAFGKTSVEGVWAVGNAGNPGALVPIASGSGATAALALNGDVTE